MTDTALEAGTAVAVTGVMPGAPAWYSLPGGRVFLPGDRVQFTGSCDLPPSQADPIQVMVTFLVEMPLGTRGDVYIAGNFGGGYPEWEPAGLQLQSPLAGPVWSARLLLPPGTVIEYKFTQGSWESVEKSPGCEEIPNRTLTVGNTPMIVRDQVEQWANHPPCG
jgi:hypothetical protein